jgi:hypothetical protein
MLRIAVAVLAACIATGIMAREAATATGLTAAQIIDRNIAARGGLDAWRKIKTMVWVGRIESAGSSPSSMPFALEQKRPNMTRFEIRTQNQISQRQFDGSEGWKMHPGRNGKPEMQSFTAEELAFARDGQGIDGPLIDYAAKGVAVMLEGRDDVEGHPAYRLHVRLPSGASQHVWIDAQTFLELKSDRPTRNALGQTGTLSVFYRNYQKVEGLQMPLLIESGVETASTRDRMVIERVALNPPLEDSLFAKPRVPNERKSITVDTRAAQQLPGPAAWPAGTVPGAAVRQQSPSGPVAGGMQ